MTPNVKAAAWIYQPKKPYAIEFLKNWASGLQTIWDAIWIKDYEKGLLKASQTSSHVAMLCFTNTETCGFCKKLDEEVFRTNIFLSWYNSNSFAAIKLDPAQSSAEVNEYGITGWPWIVAIKVNPVCHPGGGCGFSITKLGDIIGYPPGTGPVNLINQFAAISGIPGV